MYRGIQWANIWWQEKISLLEDAFIHCKKLQKLQAAFYFVWLGGCGVNVAPIKCTKQVFEFKLTAHIFNYCNGGNKAPCEMMPRKTSRRKRKKINDGHGPNSCLRMVHFFFHNCYCQLSEILDDLYFEFCSLKILWFWTLAFWSGW